MANIATLLKEEIVRLSRKQVRADTQQLAKASGRYRSDVADLKRRVGAIEKQLSRIEKLVAQGSTQASAPDAGNGFRFSAKGLRTQRERLGLSAAEMGKLLGGVSAQTVYNWEQKKSRPAESHLQAIAQLRKQGKRSVQALLAA